MAGGAVKILVAIADVDALVKKDSAIDGHAWTNTTSVYTPAEIFPMLPEKLSTDLTSLAEGQERLAVVIEMAVADDGSVKASDIYRAAVRNHAKLAYNCVAAWLDGAAPPPPKLAAVPGLDEQLRMQDRVAQAMKRVRHAQARCSLETLEARPCSTAARSPTWCRTRENRAKELIEDFMIAANGVTARYLEREGLSLAATSAALAEALGSDRRAGGGIGRATAADARRGRARRFSQRAPRRRSGALSRSLAVASSSCWAGASTRSRFPAGQSEGHFGLAVKDYTHSTAPNRRFPDLVAQRLLKAALGSATGALRQSTNSTTLAGHCTGAGGQRRQGGAAGAPSPPRRCCSPRASATASTPS